MQKEPGGPGLLLGALVTGVIKSRYLEKYFKFFLVLRSESYKHIMRFQLNSPRRVSFVTIFTQFN